MYWASVAGAKRFGAFGSGAVRRGRRAAGDSRFGARVGARTVLLNFGRATLRLRVALASSRVVLPRPKEPAAVSVPRTRSVREQL